MTEDRVNIRLYKELDYPFVLNSWLQSTYHQIPNKYMQYSLFKELNFDKIVNKLNTATIYLAELNDDQENGLLGWICVEGDMVHMVYVKQLFRQNHIATSLFKEAGIDLEKTIKCSNVSYIVGLLQDKIKVDYHPEAMDEDFNRTNV